MKKTVFLVYFLVIFINLHAQNFSCGNTFTDDGGVNANYSNNANLTYTICPNVAGQTVIVDFTAFDVENNFDALYIYDGNSTASPLISSGNSGTSVPGGLAGGYWGTQLLNISIISSSPDGCLTFVFRSDANINKPGWIANISCISPTCSPVSTISMNTLTMNSANLLWTSTTAQNWEVLLLTASAPNPISSDNGITTSTNPYTFTGLTPNTAYKFFIRNVCSSALKSVWSQAYTFTTPSLTINDPNHITQCNVPCFNLTQNTPIVLGNLNPSLYQVSYHGNLGDAQQNTNPIPNPSNHCIINAAATQGVIYIRVQEIANPNTFAVKPFSIAYQNLLASPLTMSKCDDNQDGLSCFNNQEMVSFVNQNYPNQAFQVKFYATLANAQAGVNSITSDYCTTVPNSQTIYYSIQNTQYNCTAINTLTLVTQNCTTTCPTISGVTATSITNINAVINWQTNTLATSYIIQLVGAGTLFNPNYTQNIAQTSPFTIANLSCNTQYTIYIRPICANNLLGGWSTPITFTTTSCPNGISVNPNYATNQLINDVLINSNCATVSNISTQGTAGIGYFNANNSGFIFDEGMIIRSGVAQGTAGVYTGSLLTTTGSNLTDIDLQVITNQMGQSATVKDVSFVKFDLVPTANFLSFVFMFTSNEYGTYQCSFADTFAFILTNNVTGQRTNLAVVPGTNTPVSATTIRDGAYNASCISMNPQFFGQYNVSNPNSKINMKGQTVPMTAFANVVPNQSYTLKLVIGDYLDNSFDSAVLIKGGSMVFGNQCADNLQLIPFVDTNNNGVKDAGENVFINGNFVYQVNNNGVNVNSSSNSGVVSIYPNPISNTYNIQYQIDSTYAPYYASNTVVNNASIVANSGTNIFYFPIVVTNPYNDVAINVIPSGFQPRPGFTYKNKIIYTNYGLTPASGTVSFTKDPNVTIVSATPAGFTSTATGLTFNYSNLMPFETRNMTVTMQVPTIPTVQLGNLLTNSASITSQNTDIDVTNNQSNLTQTIVGAWDPNNIVESRGEKIHIGTFNSNDYLYYTINFQNLGTASAINVVVDNLINSNLLDINTFEMINSSHNFTVTKTGNLLKWTFNDIMLESHLVSEAGSQGYIYYKIKPKPGYAVGTIIPNAADIYFDFNPAVVTDTFNTEFVTTLSNNSFNINNVSIFPNPANDNITINAIEVIKTITIMDMQGKVVLEKNNIETRNINIPISHLLEGVYTISTATDNNVIHQKLIIK